MTISLTKHKLSELSARISPDQLQDVKGFVVFIGHAHSGHSLIGALLDSLPKISITNEVNVAKLILDHNLSAKELMSILLAISYKNSDEGAWNNTGYSYKTTTGLQGNTYKPIIIGDKKGGGNTRIIRKNPMVLHQLYKCFGKKLKFVQVCRDPYDNIAAFSHYWKEPVSINHVNRYFENLETAEQIKNSGFGSFFRMNHSEFINNPKKEFEKLLNFLEISVDQSIVEKTLRIVRSSNHKRSEKIQWSAEILKEIEKKMKLM